MTDMDRRDFLRNGATAALGLGLVGGLTACSPSGPSTSGGTTTRSTPAGTASASGAAAGATR